MKTLTIVAAGLIALTSQNAKADGFLCTGQNTGLNIKVFNHTQPSEGTRNPAIMVLSDPSIASARKTIATFKDVNETFEYEGMGHWQANVDLRYNDSGRQGENVAGTKLGQLDTIDLYLKFAYGQTPTYVKGRIDYNKRNGEVLSEKVDCVRYLKN